MSVKCEVKVREEFGDYWAELSFSYDGKPLDLDDDLIDRLAIVIVDIFNEDKNYNIDNNSILCEISKHQYEVFKYENEKTIESIEECCELAERVYKKQLSRNIKE